MAAPTLSQLAAYMLDGTDTKLTYKRIAAQLLISNRTLEVEKLERAVVDELKRRGTTVIRITSPLPINAVTKQQIARYFNAKTPLFIERIDANLLGGFRAESADCVLDLTVASKLAEFKRIVEKQND